MIEIHCITKHYLVGSQKLNVLNGIDLKIEDGDFVAIMGPSGSGKSTLMNILGLLDVPSTGSYKLNGNEVSQLSEDELASLRSRELGFIFQQFNLLPRMSALENTLLPLFYCGDHDQQDLGVENLKQVNLQDRMNHKPNELSGGQQQRVAIARALINKPRMILADEPTGNLDSASEAEIMKILLDLNAQGITILMVTHEEEIGRKARRLIRMRDGKIISDDRKDKFFPTEKIMIRNAEVKKSLSKDLFTHLLQGFKTLSANKVRTFLSLLGIMIGVAAVVAMLAIGSGARKQIEEQLSSLGSNLLVLRAGSVRIAGVAQESGSTTRLDPDDARILKTEIANIKEAAPQVSGKAQVAFKSKNWSTQVQGVAFSYARMHSANPTSGRFFTDQEIQMRARVAVIGVTLVDKLFEGKNPIGETIKINRVNFQVIGVLPEKGGSGFRNQDDVVLVPVSTAMHRLLGKTYADSIELEVASPEAITAVQDSVMELMVKRHRVPQTLADEAFQILNLADVQQALSQTSNTMSVLLAAIAAISLIVGGIGIMNIMLVSVTERTKEIGLRKAIGAKRKDILMQFLTESVVVSGAGGLLGIFLGWSTTMAISMISGWATSVSAGSILLSFGTSALIGIVFGVYPARKASLLNPIEALRYE